MHFRWKIMRINFEQRWGAYKEVVAESLDKALELFATKRIGGTLHLDLNRSASRVDARNSPPNHQEEMTDGRPISKEDEALEEEDDECGDDENDIELHDHNVGDLDMYYMQKNMDHDIPYSRCYASDSDDDGPEEEVNEEGFTANEAEVHEKVLGRDHRIPLFRDLTLVDEATVDGSEGIVLGPRPTSYRDGNHKSNGISKGLMFKTLVEFKQWIKDFSVKYHRPYTVLHSDVKKRYTVKCEEDGCPWIVHARPWKGGPDWRITSCVPTHMCRGKRVDGKAVKHDH
jgi:hypothetical protein